MGSHRQSCSTLESNDHYANRFLSRIEANRGFRGYARDGSDGLCGVLQHIGGLMCAATAAAVAGTVATVASVGMSVAQSTGAMGGGGGGGSSGQFTEKQLKGFAPTKGLQSYAARLLAENATAQRPTLQEYAASGGTVRYP